MKVWKYLNTPIRVLRGQNATCDSSIQESAMLATIRAKAASYVPKDVTPTDTSNKSPLELQANPFLVEAITHEWRNKNTFPRYAQDVQLNKIKFPGHPPVVLSADMLQDLEFLKRLCMQLDDYRPKKTNVWDTAIDAKHFRKQVNT